MSKRRVLGASHSIKDGNSKNSQTENEILVCPICNKTMKSLAILNKHVDNTHLDLKQDDGKGNQLDFKKDSPIGSSNSSNTSTANDSLINSVNIRKFENKNRPELPKDHYVRPLSGMKCSDSRCNHKIGMKYGFKNCAKCGNVYCKIHCKNLVKLNKSLNIDENGILTNCCLKCLNSFDFWKFSSGLKTDRSETFFKLRKKFKEIEDLEELVLERRILKLIKWVNFEIVNSNLTEIKLRNFEKQLVDWKDENNCKCCQVAFGWFVRKHHCRICGDTVCANFQKGCSMVVPINMICKLMGEDFQQLDDSLGIRICYNCKMKVLNERVFMMDKEKDLEFFKIYKIWKLLENKLNSENLNLIQNDEEQLKIMNLFNRLDKLLKEIDNILNDGTLVVDELTMFKNLRTTIVKFIQINLPLFRKSQEVKLAKEREILQDLINNKPKLSYKDIRLKREKLMVLNEQKFLVTNMYNDLKNKRQFDDLKTLDQNLEDIDKEINQLTIELGDEAFH